MTEHSQVEPVRQQTDGLDPCPDTTEDLAVVIPFPIPLPPPARLRLRDQLPPKMRAELDAAFAAHPCNRNRKEPNGTETAE